MLLPLSLLRRHGLLRHGPHDGYRHVDELHLGPRQRWFRRRRLLWLLRMVLLIRLLLILLLLVRLMRMVVIVIVVVVVLVLLVLPGSTAHGSSVLPRVGWVLNGRAWQGSESGDMTLLLGGPRERDISGRTAMVLIVVLMVVLMVVLRLLLVLLHLPRECDTVGLPRSVASLP